MMSSKITTLFLLFFFVTSLCHAQDAISFDSLQFQYSILTEDAIYFNSNKLVKADYNGQVIWSKTGTFVGQAFKVEENGIYSFQSKTITKLDTSGNLLWSKEFITPICSMMTSQNYITDIVVNKNRIYILTYQSLPGYNYLPSLITLDTAGVIINVWCGNNYPGSTFTKGIKKPGGGAWLVKEHYGALQTCETFNVDTMGNIVLSATGAYLQSEQITFIQSAILNHNNYHSYLLNSFFPGYAREPFIVFENDNGNSFSFKGYQVPSLNWGMMLLTGTIDPNENLYILACTDNDERILFKTNPTGDILLAKIWPLSLLNTYGLNFPLNENYVQMIHNGDSLYISAIINGKTSIIAFDDSLNTICYPAAQNIAITDNPDMITGSSNLSYPVLQVINTPNILLANVQSISQPNAVNICFQNSIVEDGFAKYVNVYPNPAIDQLFIQCETENIHFELFNLSGQRIRISSEKMVEGYKLKIDEIESGMYMLVVTIEDHIIRKTIIKSQ
ncbi:MAG TPA: T9SS type A sorting domain-containing protein [Bacteroidia bacterium]|nr:T9SS type A sorting domain-containing protein [Bacteroidia bacterium]HNS13299.1 T9SS type A sorting domain-containing protein [Bacteroidia bacterium]